MKKKNRRLTNILLVCGLTTILVIPSIITKDYAKPVNAEGNQTEFSYNVAWNNNSYTQNAEIDQQEEIWQYSKKRNFNGNNYAVNVNGSFYINNDYIYTDDPSTTMPYQYIVSHDNFQYLTGGYWYKYCTRSMFVFSVIGYNINTSTQYNLSLNLQMYTVHPAAAGLYMKQTLYQSTENWNSLIDRQDYSRPYGIYDYINLIEDPLNHYNYTKTTTQTQLDNQTDYVQSYTINKTVSISPRMTNYIVIVLEPYVDTQAGTVVIGGTDQQMYKESGTTALTISGINVIPSGTYEVIDLPSLMFSILTMPFSFISQAFNLTLFPGTPYSINISNLFLAVIGVMIFVFVIKLFLSKGA